jgi:trehalose/maltose hydrolase-like predicted phosphorylase
VRSAALRARLWTGLALFPAGLGAQVPAPRPAGDSAFILSTDDPHRSPSPFIGNGQLGVLIPPLGLGGSATFLAGLYEEAPGDVPRIAGLPAWTAVSVFDGMHWLGAEPSPAGAVSGYHQSVDMRTGTARTSYDWDAGAGKLSVRVETFVSRAAPALAAIRLELVPRQAGRLRVRFALAGQPPPKRLALAKLERSEPEWRPADVWYPGHMIVRGRSGIRERSGGRLSLTATPEGRTTAVTEAAAVTWDGRVRRATARARAAGDTASLEVAFDGATGETYTFTEVVSLASALQGPDPRGRAARAATAARALGYSRLAEANAAAWAARWATDIEISGDPKLQRVVRSMLFYLLCSADSGTALGIPPMGLSSGGYYGHIFWDSDTWMFPPLLLTHPDVARSLVAFRSRTLEAARANARANGFHGAMYPWEADERGHETTPRFAIQNARSEIHVTGDVALAQWQYYLATGDSAWLARDGLPVIRATADFWLSRATRDSAAGGYHIANVVSVHEGLIGVTDDAYTNAVARKNLEIAAAASARVGAAPDPKWTMVASNLHMPYDSASEYYRTYEGAPDSTLGAVTPLLSYPLGVTMSARAKRAQLEQAVARLLAEGPGAMMGSTLLSVDAAELGDRALVDSLLPHSYQPHLRGPYLMLSETPTNDAVDFVTGAGGFLQQVIFGYTGLRLGERGLEPAFPPVLPSRITRLVLRNVQARGGRYDVIVDAAGRRIVPHEETPGR